MKQTERWFFEACDYLKAQGYNLSACTAWSNVRLKRTLPHHLYRGWRRIFRLSTTARTDFGFDSL